MKLPTPFAKKALEIGSHSRNSLLQGCRWAPLFWMSRRNSGLFSKVIKKIRRKPGIHSRERRI